MPFSFTQIEQEKSNTIKFSLAFLLFFYFLSALVLVYFSKAFFYFSSIDSTSLVAPAWPSLDGMTVGWTLLGSLLAGAVHWQFSQHALIDSVIEMMSARTADPDKDEERVFQNVVEEAGVATGGKYRIEPYIVPTAAMNAFALQDYKGRCIIGITEGLLKRLNREQLEAVIAHEAGHIASGDCLETTTTSALFKTFDNICDITLRLMMSTGRVTLIGASLRSDRDSRRGGDGRLVLFFLMLFVLASILRFIGFLGAMFISRQREYRADAISAKLTRNPMALAEALHIIDGRWKGAGLPGDRMEAIFISNPRKNDLEQTSNFIADIFTTHPPISKRIAVLLDMAHGTQQDLDAAMKKAETRYDMLNPVTAPETPRDTLTPLRGPLGPIMMPLPMPGAAVFSPLKNHCPRCRVALNEQTYEGTPLLKCPTCAGVLVKELDVLQIVHTREEKFDARIMEMGQLIRRQVKPLKQNPFDSVFDEKSIVCPSCLDDGQRMHRRFVSPQFPIEVDKCRSCKRVWFDKDELEVLQYLYEMDHPIAV